ncbi:mediator of RNA polymerase II transcription subunit 15 isoform X2 [Drosophila subobscura]|uniref:mediator of RNA polymerase II transcription subunit 15 isoform X2 n=1 Tax=Drosophila subobscura TaxID=7241 RepID=UPI00155ACCB4|nr:mediator of RNA polymerase II transcription subunit 15 isoform X2 [Drosophila subobscura]
MIQGLYYRKLLENLCCCFLVNEQKLDEKNKTNNCLNHCLCSIEKADNNRSSMRSNSQPARRPANAEGGGTTRPRHCSSNGPRWIALDTSQRPKCHGNRKADQTLDSRPRFVQAVESLSFEIQRTTRIARLPLTQQHQTQVPMQPSCPSTCQAYPKSEREALPNSTFQSTQPNRTMNESSGLESNYGEWQQRQQQPLPPQAKPPPASFSLYNNECYSTFEPELNSTKLDPGDFREDRRAECNGNQSARYSESFGQPPQQQQQQQQAESSNRFKPNPNTAMMGPVDRLNRCQPQCIRELCGRPQQPKPICGADSFGPPQQQQQQQQLQQQRLQQEQQQQQELQAAYALLHNEETSDTYDLDFKSTNFGTDHCRDDCSSECSRNATNQCFGPPSQQLQPQQPQLQAAYALMHNDETSDTFEPVLHSSILHVERCEPQCNRVLCTRPQQPQAVRGAERFGSPPPPQQQQQQQRHIKQLVGKNPLSHNDATSDRFPDRSTAPCTAECSQNTMHQSTRYPESFRPSPQLQPDPVNCVETCWGECSQITMKQSARQPETLRSPQQQQKSANYSNLHSQDNIETFKPELCSTMIAAEDEEETCVPTCTGSCSLLPPSTRSPAAVGQKSTQASAEYPRCAQVVSCGTSTHNNLSYQQQSTSTNHPVFGHQSQQTSQHYQRPLSPERSQAEQSRYPEMQFRDGTPMSQPAYCHSQLRNQTQGPQHSDEIFQDVKPMQGPSCCRNEGCPMNRMGNTPEDQRSMSQRAACCLNQMCPMNQRSTCCKNEMCPMNQSAPYQSVTPEDQRGMNQRPTCCQNQMCPMNQRASCCQNEDCPTNASSLYQSLASDSMDQEYSCPANLTMPQGHSTPSKGAAPQQITQGSGPSCKSQASYAAQYNQHGGASTSLPSQSVTYGSHSDKYNADATITLRFGGAASDQSIMAKPVPYGGQAPSMDFTYPLDASSSSEGTFMCQPSAADERLAQRTRDLYFEAMVKESCCNDVIQRTLNGRENFNERSYVIAFAGQLPQKLGLVDPLTLLEAIKMRIEYERGEIRKNYGSEADFSQSRPACQRPVIYSEDIDQHFRSKNQSEVNQSLCAYLKAENEYRKTHSDLNDTDFSANVNSFETKFFNDSIRMNIYSATTEPND